MPRFVPAALAMLAASLAAQTPFLSVKDIRPGMRGTGRTVFSGTRIDEFQVEILGVLENVGPKESLILARLSGGPLEQTGVMEGMSGSPVYIDGKLAGAVAMTFPFSKQPIAAIRPIEDMVRISTPAAGLARRGAERAAIQLAEADLTGPIPGPQPAMAGGVALADIATPIGFGGFSQATLEAFGPRLRALGLDPRQGAGGGASLPAMGNPADLQPGSMISVQLLAGDFTVDAQGTVTYIDGNRLYAFGHRFLSVGATALPFARAEVITLIPNVNTSFKLSAAREWMGSIEQDRSTAIAGELGKRPPMAPVNLTVSRGGRTVDSYHIQMVEDPLLSPLLLQMALYSAVDFTEHSVGAESLRITGKIDFQNAGPLRIANVFAADNGAAQQASLGTALPLAYLMQSGFAGLRLKSVDLDIEVSDRKRALSIDSVTAVRRQVRAGDKVTLHVLLTGDGGVESERTVEYAVPIGATPGPLYFTVSDALTANVADFRQVLTATPRTETQMLAAVNNLHPNNRAYVRVWRTDAAFQVEGADLGAVPASVALVLDPAQSNQSGIAQSRNSKIAEIEIDGGEMVISGAKTIQVEVKE